MFCFSRKVEISWVIVVLCRRRVAPVQDFNRRKSDADRYSSSSRTWKDSDGFSEPVECELARSGRHRVAKQSNADHHVHCDHHGGRYDHNHAVADLNDVRVHWGGMDSSQDATHDERLGTADYEQQLQRHGWRMEVHGDPLNLKCVSCRSHQSTFSNLFSF